MKKTAAIVLGVSIAASTAIAGSVTQAADGIGNFLIAPLYVAKGNVCSKITIQNTDSTHSILAKVAIREQIASREVDLPIFLSPGDVWSGQICQGKNGDIYLTSTDDSNHPAAKAQLKNGVDLNKISSQAGNVDVDFKSGYIEVYPIAEFNEHSTNKVDKSVLVNRWNALINGKYPANTERVKNYLAGNIQFLKNGYATSTLPMTAFKNAQRKVLTGSVVAYGNDTGCFLLGTQKCQAVLKVLEHKNTLIPYSNYGKDQFVAFTYPFSYESGQIRKFDTTVRDMEENKDVKKSVVIFSPAPKVNNAKYMKNEVAIISLSEMINKTTNPKRYKEGQIEIKNIINMDSYQQKPAGSRASFIPTFFTVYQGAIYNAYNTPADK